MAVCALTKIRTHVSNVLIVDNLIWPELIEYLEYQVSLIINKIIFQIEFI